MKKSFLILLGLSLFTGFLLGGCSSAPVNETPSELIYNYANLKLMDLDQMTDLIQQRVKRYKKTGDDEAMAEALQLCLSRPDEDAMVGKLIENIRFNLESDEQWEELVDGLVEKSIARLKNETTPAVDQVSYLILLENLLAQFRPEFLKQAEGPSFEGDVIGKIAEARLQVSDVAASERRLNLMSTQRSPSDMARDILRSGGASEQ